MISLYLTNQETSEYRRSGLTLEYYINPVMWLVNFSVYMKQLLFSCLTIKRRLNNRPTLCRISERLNSRWWELD